MSVLQEDTYCCQPWDLETTEREEIRVAVLKWVVGEGGKAEGEAKNGTAAEQQQGQAAEEVVQRPEKKQKTAGEEKQEDQGATGEKKQGQGAGVKGNQIRNGEALNIDLLPDLLDFMAPLRDPARKVDMSES